MVVFYLPEAVLGLRLETEFDTSLNPGHQVEEQCSEWDGMTGIAHLVFAQSAMPLAPVLALKGSS